MRMRRSRVVVGVALTTVVSATLLFVAATPARACSCALVEPEAAVQAADGALVGVVDAVDDPGAPTEAASWTLTVTDWVKGRLTPGQVIVRAPIDTAACGLGEPAGEFGLFVRLDRDRVTASLCDMTTAEAMRAIVGPGTGIGEVASVAGFPLASPDLEDAVTAQQASDGRVIERTWLGWLSGFVAVGVVIAAAAGAVALIRRRRG